MIRALVLTAALLGPGSSGGELDGVLRALGRGELTPTAAVEDLVAAASEPTELLELLAAEGLSDDSGWRAFSDAQRGALLAALTSQAAEVQDELLAGLDGESPRALLRAALALCAHAPSNERLERATTWIGSAPGSLGRGYEALALAVLRDVPGGDGMVRTLLRERDEAWTPALLRALGSWQDERAFIALGPRLFEGQPHLALALEQVERLADRAPRPDAVLMSKVRDHLDSDDPAVSAAAASAAARLGDARAAEALVRLLDSDRAATRRAACDALQQLGGADYVADLGRWRAWLDREQRWYDERFDAVLEGLGSADDHAVLRAVTEAGAHPLYRLELGGAVAGLLVEPAEAHRLLACAALEQLRARTWAPELVPLLDDDSPRVRAAALRALRALTNNTDLSPDPAAWRAWYEDQR